ncbi:kinase, partial [Patescibacteria group bacterium]
YVEQDHFRRIVLREKDVSGGLNIEFIKESVLFLLSKQHDVILEGILDSRRYEGMLKELVAAHPCNNFFFYFDISLEETLRRHKTKPNKDDFGEKELRNWYRNKEFLGFIKEEIISENSSAEETVKTIQFKSGLI